MARAPQRGATWSFRQAHLAADVTEGTGRSVVRSGVLGELPASGWTIADILALKVAATVAGVVFPGEARPANTMRSPLPRETDAVRQARNVAAETPTGAVLLVYPHQAAVAHTPAELAAAVLSAGADPYLVLPVGQWLDELASPTTAAEVA